jgi:integrase
VRRGEALPLRWTDLDLDTGTATIRRAFVTVGYQVVDSTPKSGKGRAVDLDPQTVAVLRAHKARLAQERLDIGPAYDDQGLVFARKDGAPLHPDRVSKMFDAYVKRAGLRRIRLHDLRHTHAAHLILSGANPLVVQQRLGHHSVAFTLSHYGHLFPSMQRQAATAIGELMGGALTVVQE